MKKQIFEKGKSLRAESEIRTQFSPRITPDNWQTVYDDSQFTFLDKIYYSLTLKLPYNLQILENYIVSRNYVFRLHIAKNLCLLFFTRVLFFYQMIALQKLWQMFFISSKELFSSSRYLNFCTFHTFQIQKDKWKQNNWWCHELACINFQIWFL